MVADRKLKIEVPTVESDQVRFGRVGIIAIVGFAIGILWPRLAGVKLAPSAPNEGEAPTAETPPADSAEPAGSGAPPAPVAPPPPAAKVEPAPAEPSDRLKIGESQVTSCRDDQNNRLSECGSLDFDSIASSRIRALASCEGIAEAKGTLSLGFELDFKEKRVKEIWRGKSTTLSDTEARALVECAKKEFSSATLSGVKNQHAAYTVFYRIELLPPGVVAEPSKPGDADAGAEASAASGRATVSWEVAILRSAPKEGDVVARILRGTRVVVTTRQGDWYKVKYDAKGNEAWVYRSAIGL